MRLIQSRQLVGCITEYLTHLYWQCNVIGGSLAQQTFCFIKALTATCGEGVG